MAAYLSPVRRPRCEQPGCIRPATCQLFNTYNAPLRWYCASHGNAALKALEAADRRHLGPLEVKPR